jgi:single-strand DNA-binding protein
MSGEFRVVGDPKLRYTDEGTPVANVRLVANKRRKNNQGGWEDDPEKVLWANATLWRKPAENLANSIRDKDLVIVKGTFYLREFEHNGVRRQSVEIEAEHIAPSLTFRTTPHSDQQQGQQPQGQQPPQYGQWGGQQQPAYTPPQGQPAYVQGSPSTSNPWGTQQGTQPEQGWPGGQGMPPF